MDPDGCGCVCVAHDPGARNALAPVVARVRAAGRACRLVDLRAAPGPVDLCGCGCLVAGSSTNQAERPWLAEANRLGLPTIQVLDLPAGLVAQQKLTPVEPEHTANLYLVPDAQCARRVTQLFVAGGLHPRVVVAGSPHLEQLALRPRLTPDAAASARLSCCDPGQLLVCYLACPEEPGLRVTAETAIQMLKAVLDGVARFAAGAQDAVTVLVRAHPRSSPALLDSMAQWCGQAGVPARLEPSGAGLDNFELLQVADCVLSHTSSMLIDCIVLRIPAGFVAQGWEDAGQFQAENFAGELEAIPRLEGPSELGEFLRQCKEEAGTRVASLFAQLDIGKFEEQSPLKVCWECIEPLLLTTAKAASPFTKFQEDPHLFTNLLLRLQSPKFISTCACVQLKWRAHSEAAAAITCQEMGFEGQPSAKASWLYFLGLLAAPLAKHRPQDLPLLPGWRESNDRLGTNWYSCELDEHLFAQHGAVRPSDIWFRNIQSGSHVQAMADLEGKMALGDTGVVISSANRKGDVVVRRDSDEQSVGRVHLSRLVSVDVPKDLDLIFGACPQSFNGCPVLGRRPDGSLILMEDASGVMTFDIADLERAACGAHDWALSCRRWNRQEDGPEERDTVYVETTFKCKITGLKAVSQVAHDWARAGGPNQPNMFAVTPIEAQDALKACVSRHLKITKT